MLYAVIDTNVFVSAFITHNPDAATSKVVDFMFHGQIKPMYNDDIMAEYEEVLSRACLHISPLRRNALFAYIRECGIVAERKAFNKLLIDESDRVFYEIALSKEDAFLVTGNLKHFPVDTRVVTPAQMLQIIEEQL